MNSISSTGVTIQVQRTFAANLPVLRCNLLDEIAEMARNKCVAPFWVVNALIMDRFCQWLGKQEV